MPLTPEVARLIAGAQAAEDADQRRRAEDLYLEAISKLSPADGELVGTLSINLGQNASDDERPGDAVKYYADAIRHLEGIKGEAILQCAHAHYNLARLFLFAEMPAAIIHADAARERYERFPFTSAVDLADARVLQVAVRAELGRPLEPPGVIDDTWAILKGVPYDDLNRRLVQTFLEILVSYVHAAHPSRFSATIAEISTWADPTLAARLASAVDKDARARGRRRRR